MSIGNNKVVTMNYIVKDDEGNIIQSTKGSKPFAFISGNNQILPKLEEVVDDMIIGGKKNVKINSSEAYGEYNKEAIQEVNISDFPKDMQIEIGMEFMMNSPDGKQMPFRITELNESKVTVDFNHPLAGRDLEFEVELLDIRNATEEELNHGHVHGTGGHHH